MLKSKTASIWFQIIFQAHYATAHFALVGEVNLYDTFYCFLECYVFFYILLPYFLTILPFVSIGEQLRNKLRMQLRPHIFTAVHKKSEDMSKWQLLLLPLKVNIFHLQKNSLIFFAICRFKRYCLRMELKKSTTISISKFLK